MIPAAFEYHRPADLAEALELMERFDLDAKLLAGGHSLVPTMKLRMNQPQHLIDLAGLKELKGIEVVDGQLRVGATTTHWEVESSPIVKSVLPVLSEVASVIADPLVRNRGTMGGSISNADPAADYPASVLALDAELVCVSAAGERRVKGSDWFQDLFTTALESGEILREIRFPLPPPRTAAAYLKLPHPASRFAVVGISVAITVDDALRCTRVRIGITGVGTHAVRAKRVEEALAGQILDEKAIAAAREHAGEGVSAQADLYYTIEDKQQLCRVYIGRALDRVLARARAGQFQG